MAHRTSLDKGLDAFAQRNWGRARRELEESLTEDPRAIGEYHLGLLYWRGLGGPRDVEGAVVCFARAADMGHAAAQTAFGMALRSGIGAPKDLEAARALFRSAAGAGDHEGMIQLGLMSEPDDARRSFTRAAEEGYAPAMLHLADLIMEKDPVEALAWLYASTAMAGDDAARKRAAALAKEMSAAEIDAAQKHGRAYVKNLRHRARERR